MTPNVQQKPSLRHLALDVAVGGAVVLTRAQQLGGLTMAGVVDPSAGDSAQANQVAHALDRATAPQAAPVLVLAQTFEPMFE